MALFLQRSALDHHSVVIAHTELHVGSHGALYGDDIADGSDILVNSGAVGSPFNGDGRAQYLWLTLVDGAWRPQFPRVAYDQGASLEAYESSGYLEAGGLLARLFPDEVRDARSYLVPFQMWAGASGDDLNEEAFARFRAARPDRFGPVAGWSAATESVDP